MTKYIDLLREHNQKEPGGEKAVSSEGTVEEPINATNRPDSQLRASENPYSPKPSDDAKNAAELLGESGAFEVPLAQEPSAHDDLLVDDEEQEDFDDNPVSTNPEPEVASNITPKAAPQTTNNEAFDVAVWLTQISQDLLAIFEAAQKSDPADISKLNAKVLSLLVQLEKHEHTLDVLELEVSRNIKHICDASISLNDLVQKSVMMMMYTIKIGIQLQLQQQEILQHTIAAMLHHIGMAMVPDDIRHKTGKLTKEEISLIRQAPTMAMDYLKSSHIEDNSILLAASQSSERYDGSGATGLSGQSIPWVARIVGLLSMFEALIHLRPYRQRLLPRDAIRELVNKHKKAFDPVLLKALIESISLYPVGTFVQLNTGEIGQVITVHNKFPLRPVVHINMDKYGGKIAEREINLKQQPNLMIQKCMYEESLEHIEPEST